MDELHDLFDRFEWRARDRERRQRARADRDAFDLEIEELRDRIDQLATVNRALWEILRDELGVTEDRLSAQLEAVVARRLEAGPDQGRTCDSCRRKVPAARQHCLYCGVGFE